jgi:hypothetical protein
MADSEHYGPFLVSLLGACTLVRRAVLAPAWKDAGNETASISIPPYGTEFPRFAHHPRGEDLAFCAAARAAGYQLFVEPRARCAHWMDPEAEPLR